MKKKNIYKLAKSFCELYERKKEISCIIDKKINKHLNKKRYVDFGIGCYYKAYIHSYKQDKYGEWYVFVKKREQINLPLNQIDNYICCTTDLDGVYKNKQDFMVICCN